jgi:DNA-binding CsgD family transcriptional regulator
MARQAFRLVGEDDPLARDLLAEYVATGGFGSGTLDPDIKVEIEGLATRMAQQYFERDLPDSPALYVQVASMLAGSRGRRSDVRELIKAALRHGPFDDIPPFGLAPIWATLALTSSDCLDLAAQIADRAYPAAEASGSIHNLGTAAFSVAIVSLESGALDRAEPECSRAVELTQSGVPATLPWSAGILATARRLRGDFAGARRAIHVGERTDPRGYTYGIVVYHRALLALAEGDAQGALSDALEARDRLAQFRIQDYALLAWRVPAASAAHRLGRLDEAGQYAEEELALARRAEAAKPIGIALMCCASVESDPQRQIELLEEARAVLAQSRGRLARAHAAYCLGATLRRTGSPEPARQHLLDAFDLATDCGALPLMERLRGELRALGIRAPHPTRQPGGLSPSEMRTAELAVAGHSNREIAELLHLSTSTVEFHLTRAYRKLGIRSRSELAGVLDPVGDGTG